MSRRTDGTPLKDGIGAAPHRISLETTTCWDFPYQSPPGLVLGSNRYKGCTPAMALWNLLSRYTQPGDLVVDCMAGGGTTLDVAKALGRRVVGLDLKPARSDIVRNDARHLPFDDNSVDFHFVDSPYSNNLCYSGDRRCIGAISANSERFLRELAKVALEIRRTLKEGGYMAWVISDEYRRGRFNAVGFGMFGILSALFEPVEIVVLVRHNDSANNPMWEHRARRHNFFLRGFKYLFVMKKRAVLER